MAFVRDILNTVGDDCLDYKLTLLGNKGVICEGFRSIVRFSRGEVLLRQGKVIVEITGEDLSIGELAQGYMQVLGKITAVTRRDLESGNGR